VADRDEWMRRLGPLYPGAVAIRQTTAMRWPADLRATIDDAVRAAPWMVVIGGLIGVAAWLVGWLVGQLGVAPAVRGAVAIVSLSLFGAAILDVGLARTIERWFGRDGDDVAPGGLGAIGAAGTTALLAGAVVRVVAFLAIRPSAWLAALVVTPLVGRWAALALQSLGEVIEPPVADRRSLLVGDVGWGQAIVVTAAVAVVAVVALGWAALLILVVAAAVGFGIGLATERSRGGLDGQTLAATAAVCEVVALIGIAAIAPALASPWSV
jgi:adenosylcobinamide-GDP ribazoletransferase